MQKLPLNISSNIYNIIVVWDKWITDFGLQKLEFMFSFLEVEIDNRGESDTWNSPVALYLCRFRCDDGRAAHPPNSHSHAFVYFESCKTSSSLEISTYRRDHRVLIPCTFSIYLIYLLTYWFICYLSWSFKGEYGVKIECDDVMRCSILTF